VEVDADVIVSSKLLGKERYAARTIRPRLQQHLEQSLGLTGNPRATVEWRSRAALRP